MEIGSGATGINTGDTFYYELPGTSHSYDVTWAGPYVALDVDYDINTTNAVNAHVELGLPGYTATGDQPYRVDWAHSKSVEDKAGMFGAMHFGMGANWTTAISNSVSLSLGLTYDYYNVSSADSKTYLNSAFYTALYNDILKDWQDAGQTESAMLGNVEGIDGDATAITIKELEADGWGISQDSEVKSFYKSLGIRIGLNAKF